MYVSVQIDPRGGPIIDGQLVPPIDTGRLGRVARAPRSWMRGHGRPLPARVGPHCRWPFHCWPVLPDAATWAYGMHGEPIVDGIVLPLRSRMPNLPRVPRRAWRRPARPFHCWPTDAELTCASA